MDEGAGGVGEVGDGVVEGDQDIALHSGQHTENTHHHQGNHNGSRHSSVIAG